MNNSNDMYNTPSDRAIVAGIINVATGEISRTIRNIGYYSKLIDYVRETNHKDIRAFYFSSFSGGNIEEIRAGLVQNDSNTIPFLILVCKFAIEDRQIAKGKIEKEHGIAQKALTEFIAEIKSPELSTKQFISDLVKDKVDELNEAIKEIDTETAGLNKKIGLLSELA
jgi:hypothetical protein